MFEPEVFQFNPVSEGCWEVRGPGTLPYLLTQMSYEDDKGEPFFTLYEVVSHNGKDKDGDNDYNEEMDKSYNPHKKIVMKKTD